MVRSIWLLGMTLVCLGASNVARADTTPAGSTIEGRVTGGGERYGLTVSALASRHLGSPVLATAAVGNRSGRFSIALPSGTPRAFLVVTAGCDPTQGLGPCRRYFPNHGLVSPGAPVRLEIPDLDLTARLWAGERSAPGPLRGLGIGVILVGLLLAAWFFCRAQAARTSAFTRAPAAWSYLGWLLPGFSALLAWRLGSEPMDLLEYSYFHEGVRPESVGALLRDSISAELAHGPVMPLILRAMAAISPSPWLLRLPSAVFGLLFVLVVFDLARRLVPARHAAAVALVVALAPVGVFYARDASPYALAGLCAAAAVWLPLCGRPGARRWVVFALVHTVGFFTHYGFAFFSASQALALLVAWWRSSPRALAGAALAFSAAAVLPTLIAPDLEHMVTTSGIRFAFMSPIYPESPGVVSFALTFLTVLVGLPSEHPWLLIGVLPLLGVGLRAIWGVSRPLAWMLGAQLALLLVWLVFSHAMSTSVGGGRIFYAFRWTRPLLLGLWFPLGAVVITRWRWALIPFVGLLLMGSLRFPFGDARPAQEAASSLIRGAAGDHDVWAVLPAGFYSDPAQYYLAAGAPPALVTFMRERQLELGDGRTIRGPVVEIGLTLETALDRIAPESTWVLAYRESMFGVPKFDPAATDRTIGWLDNHLQRAEHHSLPMLDVFRYTCDVACQWAGTDRLVVPLNDAIATLRYRSGIVPATLMIPDTELELVIPAGARQLRSDHLVQVRIGEQGSRVGPTQPLTLPASSQVTPVRVRPLGETALRDVTLEFHR